jgi:hypothetical protein
MIVGNVFGRIEYVHRCAQGMECDAILSTGNLGIFYPTDLKHSRDTLYRGYISDFREYILGKLELKIPLYCIRGRWDSPSFCKKIEGKRNIIRNFLLMKNGVCETIYKGDESVVIGGLGGYYTRKSFNASVQTYRYFHLNDHSRLLESNPTPDILLLHDVMGNKYFKKIEFTPNTVDLLERCKSKYTFLGQYNIGYNKEVCGTYFSCCPHIDQGFYFLNTTTNSLMFVNNCKEKI